LTILNGVLHLFPIQSRWLRLPIDIFFRSLALDKLNKSAGIILSGMGSDGSLGIKQRTAWICSGKPTTKFDSMPPHTTQAILVDIVA
jgi:two-component system CheB/CheR fusion protein